MTVKEAAQYLAVPPATLYARVWRKEIRFVRLGRSVRFDKQDLDALIDSNKVEPADHYPYFDRPGESHS
jgi:excisionase family DNA binding protein